MVYNPELFQKVGDLVGFEYKSNGTHERFHRDHLEDIADELGIDYEGINSGRLKERIGEETGFDFEQGYSCNPKDLNTAEVRAIIDTLQSKVKA